MNMSVADIKKMLKDENLILGTDRALKLLKSNELEKIYLASNAPRDLVNDVERYALLNSVTVEKLDVPNDELGTICKKPFSIVCIGMRKKRK